MIMKFPSVSPKIQRIKSESHIVVCVSVEKRIQNKESTLNFVLETVLMMM